MPDNSGGQWIAARRSSGNRLAGPHEIQSHAHITCLDNACTPASNERLRIHLYREGQPVREVLPIPCGNVTCLTQYSHDFCMIKGNFKPTQTKVMFFHKFVEDRVQNKQSSPWRMKWSFYVRTQHAKMSAKRVSLVTTAALSGMTSGRATILLDSHTLKATSTQLSRLY